MKDVVYLKVLSSTLKVMKEDNSVQYSTTYQVKFNKAYPGLKEQYGSRLIKFLKKKIADNGITKAGVFTITKTARCSEEDVFDEKKGETISRVKVEIATCKISSAMLSHLYKLMKCDQELLQKQVGRAEIQKASETEYFYTITSSIH